MNRISKFDFALFYGDDPEQLAISKQRYTRESAITKARYELEQSAWEQPEPLMIGDAYVTHRAGVNAEGEPAVGWWLDYMPYKRSCPVWVFHRGKQYFDAQNGYTEVPHHD